jgi:glycosyltransferase 2 family protein
MTEPSVGPPRAEPIPAAPEPRPWRYSTTAVKIGFGIAVLTFGVWFIASRWSRVRAALDTARPGWLVLAAGFAVLGLLASMAGFRAVLTAVARRLPIPDVARVHFISQLGKYVPGSVWPIVALSELGRRYQISRRAAASAGVLTLVFSLVTGAVVGVTLVVIAAARGSSGLWWLLLLIPVAFVLGHPRVVMWVVNRLLRLIHRQPLEVELQGRALREVLAWPLVAWLFLGLQCWALVVALGGSAAASVVPAIGGFALAYTAGTLFIPAPAGAGIRDAILAVALAGVLHDRSSFNHDSIIVVVLLSRVLLAALDFALAGFALLLARNRRRRET